MRRATFSFEQLPDELKKQLRPYIVTGPGQLQGIPKAPAVTAPCSIGVCPHLVRNCCGQPGLCRLTGREIDLGVCQDCTSMR
jgi:hypothetical protein